MTGKTDYTERETEDCGFCGSKIDLEKGFYHEEITDWRDRQNGVGEDFYYHRECYRIKMELLHHAC